MRHAQGIHNVEGEKNHDAYLSYDLFDAQVTPLGWQQVITIAHVLVYFSDFCVGPPVVIGFSVMGSLGI